MLVVLVLRRTILPGGSRTLAIELPSYRLPGWCIALVPPCLSFVGWVTKIEGTDRQESLYRTLHRAVCSDGTVVFTTATCASLPVFYILTAQCLPASVVVRQEINGSSGRCFKSCT
jgi:Fe2+ transport system protein B